MAARKTSVLRKRLVFALHVGLLGQAPRDQADDDGIWITEIWDDKASHDASLSLPAVKKTIAAARPVIAAFNTPVVTTPVGGHGLRVAKHAN